MQKLFALVPLLSFYATAQFPATPPLIISVLNPGSNDQRFCAGMLVQIGGNNFVPLGVAPTVTVGNQAAYIQSAVSNLIVAQLPLSLLNGPTTLTVKTSGGSASFGLTIYPFAPAFDFVPAIADASSKEISVSNPAFPGEPVIATMVGLGPTNPLVSITTSPPTTAPTTTLPTVTVGGLPAQVTGSVIVSDRAIYHVSFTIPTNIALRDQDVVVSMGGITSQASTIPIGAATGTTPTITNVFNFADDRGGLSPGALAAIVGQNLGSTTAVSVGGKPAFIGSASATQVNIELPIDLPVGGTTLTVTSGSQTSEPINLTIDTVSPAFFAHGLPTFRLQEAGVFLAEISALNPASPGNSVFGRLVGLGPTNPLVPTGKAPTGLAPTVARPMITVGGRTANFSSCGLIGVGIYEIVFTLPIDTPLGNQDVILTIGDKSSPSVTLIVANAPQSFLGFRNAASGQLRDSTHGIAPNTFLSIYSTNIGSTDSQGNLFPSTNYLNTQVLFNDKPAPLYNVLPSANLINVAIPSELADAGTNIVTIMSSNGITENLILTMASTDVGVFRIPDPTNPSRQIAAATVANTAQVVLPQATAAAYKFAQCPGASPTTSCAGPAHAGDSIVIYFTGGGRATPNGDPNGNPVPTGSVAPPDGRIIYKTVLTPILTIGGIPAPVLFSGIAPGTAAEYQINTVIPTGVTPGDDVAVVLFFEGNSDTVTISVKNP